MDTKTEDLNKVVKLEKNPQKAEILTVRLQEYLIFEVSLGLAKTKVFLPHST